MNEEQREREKCRRLSKENEREIIPRDVRQTQWVTMEHDMEQSTISFFGAGWQNYAPSKFHVICQNIFKVVASSIS